MSRRTTSNTNPIHRQPYKPNRAMAQSLDRTAELYPESRSLPGLTTRVPLTRMDDRHEGK